MADTPRVTVPVENLRAELHDHLIAARRRKSLTVPKDLGRRLLSALSAAPAPEGGAVDASAILEMAAKAIEDHQKEGREWIKGSLWDDLTREAAGRIRALKSALATREEAPAEAGLNREIARMREVARDWRRPALQQVEGPNDLKIYGGTIADDIDRWADLLSALRAQPPAREDAQPVAWLRDAHEGHGDECLVPAAEGDPGAFAVYDRPVPRAQPVADAVEPIERAVAALKGHIEAIQVAKADGGSSSVITDCVNGLPEIVRWIESGVFNVEAAFEQHEDTHPAPDALRGAVEALEPFARAADKLDGHWSEDDWRWNDSVRSGVTVRDIRRARQVRAALQAEQGAK